MRAMVWTSVLVLAFVGVGAAHAAERGDIVVRGGYSSVFANGDLSAVQAVEETFSPPEQPQREYRSVQQIIDISVTDSEGLYLDAEYRVTDLFGIGLSISQFDTDIEGTVRSSSRFFIEGARAEPPLNAALRQRGSIGVMPVMASFNIHHMFGRVDFFFGGRAGYVFYDDFELNGRSVEPGGEMAFGWLIGADFPLGRSEHWMVHASLNFVRTNAKIEVEHIDEVPDDFEDFAAYAYETNQGKQSTFASETFEDGALNVHPFELRIGVAYRF